MTTCAACGWSGDPAEADRHLCNPRRSHGVPGTYCAGCRCTPCTRAQARYQKVWRWDHARGLRRTTTAEQTARVVAHVDHLVSVDWTASSVATHAGVSRSIVTDLAGRRAGQAITVRTATRILAVHHARPGRLWDGRMLDPDDETFVPVVGTLRRIEALMAAGWTHQAMLAESGVRTAVLLHQSGRVVTWRNHLRLATAYDRLALQPGPSERTRLLAARRGWAPALAWDDDTIDDPHATPAGLRRPRDDYRQAHPDDIAELLLMGHTRDQAADRLGVTRGAVDKALDRARAAS